MFASETFYLKKMDIPQEQLSRILAAIPSNPALSPRGHGALPSISVVAPAYNEEEVIVEFYRRVVSVLDATGAEYEIVLVNDGSRDRTLGIMLSLQSMDARVSVVDLSRNFGKEIALTAGLEHTKGDVVVVLDSDLQDPPELIPEMIGIWREGYDIVYGVRSHRDGETWFKKTTAKYFYSLIQAVSRVDIPKDTGDFRLMSRRAVLELLRLREEHRFMKGLFAWIGFPAKPLHYRRDARAAGQTKWNYWNLWNFALEGITSFTVAPLKVATYVGLAVAMLALMYGVFVIWKAMIFGDSVKGYPSLMAVILFLGGVQLISVGVLGEYIGRIFNEVKRRPLYLINRVRPSALKASSIETSIDA